MDSLFIIQEQNGSVIIEKHWKKPSNSTVVLITNFWLTKADVVKVNENTLFTVCNNGLYYIALASSEKAPLGVFYMLELLLEILTGYFGNLSEQVIKDNFATVYEVLEELIDSGSPYITESTILHQLVPPPSILSSVISAVSTTASGPAPTGMASSCPWRVQGIQYAHNEIFFDIVEELDCIVDKYWGLKIEMEI